MGILSPVFFRFFMLPDLCVRPAMMADREALVTLVEDMGLEPLLSNQIVMG